MGKGRSGWDVIFEIIAGGLSIGGNGNILWFILLIWQMRTFPGGATWSQLYPDVCVEK